MTDLLYVLLVVSSFIVYGTNDGGISPYSPGIPISLFVSLLILIGYSFRTKFLYSKEFLFKLFASLFFLIITIILSFYNNESLIVYIGKSCYLISTLFTSLLVTKKNAELIFKSLLILFLIDLVYRLIFKLSPEPYTFKVHSLLSDLLK